MKTGDLAITVLVVGLVAAAGAAYVLDLEPATLGIPTKQVLSGPVVTLRELIAGEFPSALDKNGTLGAAVSVLGLRVLYVNNETDGDWHVGVTDGVVPVFITEITPKYQASLGRPMVGSVIDESGSAFCDVQHENESWHGDTCWEVHPITAWRIAGGPSGGQTTMSNGSRVSVGFGEDEPRPGTVQTIFVSAQGFQSLAGLDATVTVDYLPGQTASLSCVTGRDGSCSVTMAIPRSAISETYAVEARVGQDVVYSAFLVVTG